MQFYYIHVVDTGLVISKKLLLIDIYLVTDKYLTTIIMKKIEVYYNFNE